MGCRPLGKNLLQPGLSVGCRSSGNIHGLWHGVLHSTALGISAPAWSSPGAAGKFLFHRGVTLGCRGISVLAPGAPLPPPSLSWVLSGLVSTFFSPYSLPVWWFCPSLTAFSLRCHQPEVQLCPALSPLELAVFGMGQPLASSHRDLPTTCSLPTTKTLPPTPRAVKALNNVYIGKYLCICAALQVFFCLQIGSAILLKLQNILLEYERIIEHEKNRYLAVWREVRKLESEKESSQLRAEETQEWKNDIQSLKYVTLCSDNVLSCQCFCFRRC